MSPSDSRGGPLTTDRPTAENPGEKFTANGTPDGPDSPTDALALFGVVLTPAPPGVPSRVAIVMRDQEDHRRGPGESSPTTGPADAVAPRWWTAEAERVVLALVEAGHQVSSDDLHERYPFEPSASGSAFGALFARLAHAGLIREVGMVRSRRPEARRRRIILWGRP